MTTEQIKEAIAKVFESYRLGKDGNTATEAAAALMALVGPKPLVWPEAPHPTGIYKTRVFRGVYYCMKIHAPDRVSWRTNVVYGWSDANSEQAAKAAAQSHADAAHWANTALANMIGEK